MTMRWEDERYVRVYIRDTTDWLALGWEAQALFVLTLRKVDRAGLLDLGRHGARGLASVVAMPVEVVERALAVLLEDGCVAISGTTLVVPNFIEAQEAAQSDAQRKRESRSKARDLAAAFGDKKSRNVTNGHDTGQKVTSGHSRSQLVTPSCAVPSRTVPSLAQEELLAASPNDSPPAPAVVSVLPCVGQGPSEYEVTELQVALWREAYPGIDVLGEVRKARAWLEANPTRRKTHRGMPAFLVSWLNRAQNGSRGGTRPAGIGDMGTDYRRKWWHDLTAEQAAQFNRERCAIDPDLDGVPLDAVGLHRPDEIAALIERWKTRRVEAA
jgi:hypothetical protein